MRAMELDLAAWRALVERDLKGVPASRLARRTDDGLTIQPLYTAADDRAPLVGARDPRSAPGWRRLVVQGHPDPQVLAARLAADVAEGADGVLLDARACGLTDAASVAAIQAVVPANLLISWVNADEALAVAVGAHTAPGLDPIALGLHRRRVPNLAATARLVAGLVAEGAVGLRVLEVDGHVWHRAGAGEAQQVALAWAAGVELLRALGAEGLTPAEAAGRIGFTLATSTRFFESIATLRAFRAGWTRILEVCGAPADLRLRVRPAERQWTRREAHLNLLRNTVAVFAGAVGGADEVVSLPLDALGEGSSAGRRLANTTPALWAEESHLDRVLDPAGGSHFIEALTDAIAEAAWQRFQAIEGRGGLVADLAAGRPQAEVAAVAAERARRVATRRQAILGVSEHAMAGAGVVPPTVPEPPEGVPVAVGPLDFAAARAALAAGAPLAAVAVGLAGEAAAMDAAPAMRDAQPFEMLRDLSDVATEAGRPPAVFLANLGPLARHLARATFTTHLLAAGGIAALAGEGTRSPEALAAAFQASGTPIACLCGHDEDYAELAVPAAQALKAAGARRVLLAGAPGEREAALRAAGVDGFIVFGGDALATLTDLLRDLETHHG